MKPNNIKNRLFIAAICIMLPVFFSCGGDVFQTLMSGWISRIEISPSAVKVASGTSRQLQATLIYSDNRKEDVTKTAAWSSDNIWIATVSEEGYVTGLLPGSAVITVTDQGVTSNITVEITGAVLTSVNVTPANEEIPKGLARQFTATGIFSDNSTQDITNQAAWSSSNPHIAAFDNTGTKGLCSTFNTGVAAITASMDGVSGTVNLTVTGARLISIEITPVNLSIVCGLPQQFTATGIYTDNSAQNITDVVVWSSDSDNIATIGETGLADTLEPGKTTITASLAGITGTTEFTVSDAKLVSISVEPLNESIAKGLQQQFIATGTYTDTSTHNITTSVTWSSSGPLTAFISNAEGSEGLCDALAAGGPVTITAILDEIQGSTNITVTAEELVSIEVSPLSSSKSKGLTQQFTATGVYTDNSSQDITTRVTWYSSNETIAFISNASGSKGLGTALNIGGPVTITAVLDDISGTAEFTVTEARLVSIGVTPPNSSKAKGLTQQFTATGVYTDNSSQDITTRVTWSSSDETIAFISNASGSKGLGTAINDGGPVTITAACGSIRGTAAFTVTDAELASISVTPVNQSIAKGLTQQFTATGTYTDNSTQNITGQVTWSSSSETIASISNAAETKGLCTALTTGGPVTITATSGNINGYAQFTVTGAVLESIGITPSNQSIAKGLTQQFTATGVYTDNSTQNITSQVTWSSSDVLIAPVSNAGSKGLCTALNTGGPVTITAGYESINGTTQFTVSGAELVSIGITPSITSKAKGLSQQFTATGVYTDNSAQNITGQVTWSSSSETIASISNAAESKGLCDALRAGGPVIITAISGSKSGTAQFTVTDAELVSIGITPSNQSIAKGLTQQFTATGVYTDNSTQNITSQVTWSSSDQTIASINNADPKGLCSALKTGAPVTITAVSGSISGTAQFTVTDAELVSIGITPSNQSKAKGLTQQFTATGIYTDNSAQNITGRVTWSSSDALIADISNASESKGLCTGLDLGIVTITAVLDEIHGSDIFTVTNAELLSIEVTPGNSSRAKGLTQQFTATGMYTDNSTQNITGQVTWSSSNEIAVSVSNADPKGLANALNAGSAVITAAYGDVSGTTGFTVTQAALVSISVTPSNANLPYPRTCQYYATGTYTDNSAQDITSAVTWDSSDTSKATISNAEGSHGIVSTITAGQTVLSAALNGKYGSTNLNVTAAVLVSVAVSPVNPSLASGMDLQFQATGVYNDNSTQNLTAAVTWSSSDITTATISTADGSKGLATGAGAGTSTITATLGTVSGSTLLTVTSATLIAVAISPADQTIANGTGLQFRATGTYSDSTTQDITGQVTWSSSDTSKAAISNAAGLKGLAAAVSPGSATITATKGSLSDSTELTVTSATLLSITITPNNPICYGTTQQFTATGNYSDSTTQNITSIVTWSSSDTDVATVSNSSESRGLATAVSVGVTNITASTGSVSKITSLEVRNLILQSVTVSPANPTVSLSGTIQFTASGTYNDGTVQDLTTQVLWSTSSRNIAIISNAAGSNGLASLIATGTVTVSAVRDGITGSTGLTVIQDTVNPVIDSANLLGNSLRITYSKPVNVTQASSVSSYKIVSATDGICSDNTNFSSSPQTSDFSITSITVVSPMIYILYISSGMRNINYSVIADRSSIRDLASNSLGCPNNQTFTGIDITPPAVSSAASLNPNTIRVSFSENVNPAEACNINSYKIVRTPAAGSCSNNLNFTSSSQTSDFNIVSVSGTGKVYDITLSATQISGASYTLIANKSSIHDPANNYLGCPNNADFTGLEQLKVSSAYSVSTTSFIVVFSKPVLGGVNEAGSAECNSAAECAYRYMLTGSSNLGTVSRAALLNGSVCGGAAADSTKVCIEHTIEQGGGQYTVTAANGVNGDGFNNSGWGSIRNSGNTENIQLSPKDRTIFVGSGTAPQNFGDGPMTDNPFNDDSAFGYLAAYAGKIYIGPNAAGNSANRFNPDGSAPESLTFAFNKDVTGTALSSNSASTRDGGVAVPPYVTMGHTGCTQNNANLAEGCGPDNNNGRGLFTSGIIGGVEYLFITGGRSDGYNSYMYWTTNTNTNLSFNYIDLRSTFNSGSVTKNKGSESISVFNNKVYWMSPGDGNYRPYMTKINDTTAESISGTNSIYLNLRYMTGFGHSSSSAPNNADRVGATLFEFKNHLYAANSGSQSNNSDNCGLNHAYAAGSCEQTGGLIRSGGGNSLNPGACTGADVCPDWTNITPTAVKFRQFFSIVLNKLADLIPADRPVPGFASFNNSLYMIRNACTTARWNWTCPDPSGCSDDPACPVGDEVPQLWKCIPSGMDNGSPACMAEDWALVAENASTGRTNMGDANNSKITLIATNGVGDTRLYIGYDNPDGVQIWRTKSGITDPASESDFEMIGGIGLADPDSNKQIFSAVSLQQGLVSYLYVSTGNSGEPVKVYRQQND